MAQGGHMAALRELTRTHAGPRGRLHGAMDQSGLVCGSTGIVGPIIRIRGAY